MLRYNMPLQRKNLPGKRQLSDRYQNCGYGWYSQLSEDEKNSLNDPCLTLSSLPLSEDSDYGQCRNELYQNKISSVALNDQINSDMFRNHEENACAFIKYMQGRSYPGQNNSMNIQKVRATDQSKLNLRVSKKIPSKLPISISVLDKNTIIEKCSDTASNVSTRSVSSKVDCFTQTHTNTVTIPSTPSSDLIDRLEYILCLTMRSTQTAHCNVILEIQSVLSTLILERSNLVQASDDFNLETSTYISSFDPNTSGDDIPHLAMSVINLYEGSNCYRKHLPSITQHGSWFKDYSSIMFENYHKSKYESLWSTEQLPMSFSTGYKCAHIFQSQLHITMNNAVHLMSLRIGDSVPLSTVKLYKHFLERLIFHNPIWDFGLQFHMLQCFPMQALYFEQKDEDFCSWTSCCICPCSNHFGKWHDSNNWDVHNSFKKCGDIPFRNPFKFIEHVQEMHQKCIYHFMILCILKTNYSWLFKCQETPLVIADLIEQQFESVSHI